MIPERNEFLMIFFAFRNEAKQQQKDTKGSFREVDATMYLMAE